MDNVEQAVFTSAQTEHASGYQLLGRSEGVCEEDARELAVWGPSHDSLLALSADAQSYNFHALPSGAYCVSRTTSAGFEYSGRGGHRVYTQCLIVRPNLLRRFSNNPFAVVRAAMASGMLRIHQRVPAQLTTLSLVGGASAVDQELLRRLTERFGAEKLAGLLQVAMNCRFVAVIAGEATGEVIAGLLNCLPPACRSEFSFSTGLKYSSRRPFRLIGLSDDPAEHRWIAHRSNIEVVNLLEHDPTLTATDGWPQFVGRALATGRRSLLATELTQNPWDIQLEELNAWGLQLLEEVDVRELRGDGPQEDDFSGEELADGPPTADAAANADGRAAAAVSDGNPNAREAAATNAGGDASDLASLGDMSAEPALANDQPDGSDDQLAAETPSDETTSDDAQPTLAEAAAVKSGRQIAHAAHRQFQGSPSATASQPALVAPSGTLAAGAPEALEMLEQLDDLVFEAIAGDQTALDELRSYWPQVLAELGDTLVAESREQYLRYALSVWEDGAEQDATRQPQRAVHALEVLTVLFDGNF